MEEEKVPKRLSLITDIIILLAIIFVTVLLIQQLDISGYGNEEEVSSLVVSANSSSISEENEEYIKKIKNEYGITVMYGKDITEYANKVEGKEQNDIYIVNNNLKIIYGALQKYPVDIFYKVKTKDYPMYIMLLDKFENNNLALASRTSLNVYRIYISNNERFERSFHHEMYHILEYWMENQEKYIYSSWYRLNPMSFDYETDVSKLDNTYVYGKNKSILNSNSAYFLTMYSKTSAKEDRAEIFAELMIQTKHEAYLDDENIRKKVDTINTMIKTKLTKSSFYYSKYLN